MNSPAPPTPPAPTRPSPGRSSAIDRFLTVVERGGNALPHPATLFAILAMVVVLLSWVASQFALSVQHPTTGEITNWLGQANGSFVGNDINFYSTIATSWQVVGTGDFTHPAWYDHLGENLVEAAPGVFRLRDDLDRDIDRRLPPSLAGAPVRFMLSVEISTIYKRGDRTRKVHHLIYMPDLSSAARFNARLAKIGNLGSDGRPILGLDSRDLLEVTLECGGYLVPAHVWTPWFAVLGSKSGFDAIEDCYVDLASHVFAVETGLSSDPEMNWRVSGLDKYRLVSNSDAHSPPVLGREATVFDTELDYYSVRKALETGEGFAGTLEFFPEEGKYHVDGHRKCGVRMEPRETSAHNGICPECGKPLTVGVLSRVEELADRPHGARPPGAAGFTSLVPLPEVMSEIVGTGENRVTASDTRLTGLV